MFKPAFTLYGSQTDLQVGDLIIINCARLQVKRGDEFLKFNSTGGEKISLSGIGSDFAENVCLINIILRGLFGITLIEKSHSLGHEIIFEVTT